MLGDFPNKLPTGEALDLGWKVTLMGVSIVFIALVCLIILTIVYPKVFGWILPRSRATLDRWAEARASRKRARLEIKAVRKLGVTAEPASVEQPAKKVVTEASAVQADSELIAVITAAIAASLGTSSNGIRIKSLRRSGSSTPAWGREGRYEQFRF